MAYRSNGRYAHPVEVDPPLAPSPVMPPAPRPVVVDLRWLWGMMAAILGVGAAILGLVARRRKK